MDSSEKSCSEDGGNGSVDAGGYNGVMITLGWYIVFENICLRLCVFQLMFTGITVL